MLRLRSNPLAGRGLSFLAPGNPSPIDKEMQAVHTGCRSALYCPLLFKPRKREDDFVGHFVALACQHKSLGGVLELHLRDLQLLLQLADFCRELLQFVVRRGNSADAHHNVRVVLRESESTFVTREH